MAKDFTAEQLFRIHKANLIYAANRQIQNCVLFLDEKYRGLGKTICINEISLNLMSDGYKILMIGHRGVEYYCDKFENVFRIDKAIMRGLSRNYIILVDEILVEEYQQILNDFPNNLVYGFGRDY